MESHGGTTGNHSDKRTAFQDFGQRGNSLILYVTVCGEIPTRNFGICICGQAKLISHRSKSSVLPDSSETGKFHPACLAVYDA